MKQVTRGLIFLLLVGTMSAGASMLQRGTQEILADGLVHFDSPEGTLVSLRLGWGIFVSDFIELGVQGGLRRTDDVAAYSLGGFGEYHFDLGTLFVPYVGAAVSAATVDMDGVGDETAVILGGSSGFKMYLVDNVALTGRAVLEVATEDIYASEKKLKNWDARLELGLRFYY